MTSDVIPFDIFVGRGPRVLHHNPKRLLEQLLDVDEELGRIGAVEDLMVAAKREGQQ